MKWVILLIAILTLDAQAWVGTRMRKNSATNNPPQASSLVLFDPSTSPGTDTTPTITVNGVANTDTVKIYTDASCNVSGLKGTAVASGTSINITSSALTDGNYTFKAEVINAGGYSSGCSSASVAYLLDTTAPSMSGSVADGTSYASLTSSPTLTWTAGDDSSGSGVSYYQLAIGTTSGGTNVLNWTNIGNVTSYQRTGLSLTDATTYYASVRAVDAVGFTSNAINSDGWVAQSGPNLNAITLTELNVIYVGSDQFSVQLSYDNDQNANSSATLYYCNQTDSPGCDPLTGSSVAMTGSGDKYNGTVSGLVTPNNPGDTLNIKVAATDSDGVLGSPMSTTVTLNTPHRYWRIAGTGITATRWQVDEIEMRTNASPTQADLTSTTFTIASSTAGGSAATDAFDNAYASFWKSGTSPLPHWIGQDFGAGNTKWINEVFIRVDTPADEGMCTLQYSDDAVTWTNVFDLYATVGGSWALGRGNPYWVPTATTSAPAGRDAFALIYTGSKVVIWGGSGAGGTPTNTGGVFDPVSNSWTATNTSGAPIARYDHSMVWTGSHAIVWGGHNGSTSLNNGYKYDVNGNSWSAAINSATAPSARSNQTAVWTGTEMIIWGGYETGGTHTNTGARYNVAGDSWTATSVGTNVPSARQNHTALWTGTEMLIWGGTDGTVDLNTGSRYDPTGNSWTAITTTGAPTIRWNHVAVYTGTEMIVWGGVNSAALNTGGRYNLASNTWTATSTTGAPVARYGHTGAWSGSELIVFGGQNLTTNFYNDGGRYNPASDTWVATPMTNAPSARSDMQGLWGVWATDRFFVWGGRDISGVKQNTGGMLMGLPHGAWTATNTTGAPTARSGNTAVWTGSEMVIWGGWNGSGTYYNTGGRYNPVSNSWTATSTTSAPTGRQGHVAVYVTGASKMVVWGGNDGAYLASGGRYDPGLNSWQTITATGAPAMALRHSAVASTTEMLVWGGWTAFNANTNTGGRYNPATDAWTAINTTGAPTARNGHVAVWNGTGSKMLIYGGSSNSTGGIYDAAGNSWTAITTTNGPAGNTFWANGVWSGTEFIFWGGQVGFDMMNTGGRYNPTTNTWKPTSIVGAPSARYVYNSVWTGSKMIVWGGQGGTYEKSINSGGVYDPTTDTWLPTPMGNAPEVRSMSCSMCTVWTGTQMIIWGGTNVFTSSVLNNGGIYTP
jgi:hypothetical protein